ncbi:MAG: hypothetical protein ACJ8AW_20845, partial [Rhodopila sp.]
MARARAVEDELSADNSFTFIGLNRAQLPSISQYDRIEMRNSANQEVENAWGFPPMSDSPEAITNGTDVSALIGVHAEALSKKLQRLRRKQTFGPLVKPLRAFSTAETAKFLGIKEGYLRVLSLGGKGPKPAVSNSGRRSYTAEQILELRQ